MKYKYFIFHTLLVICFSLIVRKYFGVVVNTFYPKLSHYILDDIRPSSVWCNGLDQSQRRCRFVNLCYKKDTKDYLFLLDENISMKSGVPFNRFSPALVDMSSVSNHNQFYFNYIEIPFNVLLNNLSKAYRIETLSGRVLIMSRFKADNLMHYFHDDLIPLYSTLQELGSKQIDYIFLDDIYSQQLHKPFKPNVFESVFPKSFSRNDLNEKTIICFEESFIGLSKSITWYDYGFRSPQSPINRSIEESEFISKTIRKFTNELILSPKCVTPFVVFISRQLNRKIINEKSLIDFISNSTKLPLIIINDLNENIELIIEKVFCAKLLIGMHGSALILSLFLKSGSSLIELFPFGVNPHYITPYKTLTQLKEMKINYFYWRNRFINHTITHFEYLKELGGIEHLSNEDKQRILFTTEDVPKHLCCSDPYWLYRIYSDTIVDINSFGEVLEKAIEKSSQDLVQTNDETIAPGVVMNLSCKSIQTNDNHFRRIVWQKPWNLDYIQYLRIEIKYEVLTQEVPSVSAKSSLVVRNEFSFLSEPNKRYNIWIRCKLNDIYGPFNTNPLIC